MLVAKIASEKLISGTVTDVQKNSTLGSLGISSLNAVGCKNDLFVGVAIVSIYTKKRADNLPFRKQLIVFIECLIQPFFCSRNLFQLKQDHLKELILRMGLRSFHIEF